MKNSIILTAISILLAFTTSASAQNKILKDTIVSRADVKPSFIGGDDALFTFINENLKHPKNSDKSVIKSVRLSFIVEKDGRLTDIQIERSPSRSHSRKAKKVVRKMPNWKPALIHGQPVRFRFRLPVVFKIKETKTTKLKKWFYSSYLL